MTEKSLEERFAALEHEVDRLQSVIEIQNLVGRYAVIHTPISMSKTPELFALKQPDVSVEIAMWGVFIGAEKIKRMYATMSEGDLKPGAMFEHQFTTPQIVVAKDGKTAKGLWFSPGHETPPAKDGKLEPHWCWGKYGADFIKEDGEWKIWHLHFYDTFMIPFDKSWVDTPQPPLDFIEEQPGVSPDKRPTCRTSYFPDMIREPVPWYPEPYDTWDGKSLA
jgi:hypothetical protein